MDVASFAVRTINSHLKKGRIWLHQYSFNLYAGFSQILSIRKSIRTKIVEDPADIHPLVLDIENWLLKKYKSTELCIMKV